MSGLDKLTGGGVPINGLLPLYTTASVVNPPDGTTWLKSGVVETDLSLYPAATVGFGVTSAPISFVGRSAPTGLAWDGTYFWYGNSGNVYKHSVDGLYTGTSFSTGGQDTDAKGIAWDGTNFWRTGITNDRVYKYTSAGVYTGINFSLAAQALNPYGLAWDGTHFWVSNQNPNTMFKYTSAFVYTGVSFPIVASVYGVTWDGTNFWLAYTPNSSVYEYTPAGVLVKSFPTSPLVNVRALAWNDTDICITGAANGDYYTCSSAVGLFVARTDPSSLQPFYTRVA